MNEWLKTNLIAIIGVIGGVIGLYTTMNASIEKAALQTVYLEQRLSAAESRLQDHASRLTNNEIVDEKQSVLLNGIAKIVDRIEQDK